LLDVAKNTPIKIAAHPIIIPSVIISSANKAPHIIPNIGKKYATVDVLTAPIFSIRYT
jgi:hypothetical protein